MSICSSRFWVLSYLSIVIPFQLLGKGTSMISSIKDVSYGLVKVVLAMLFILGGDPFVLSCTVWGDLGTLV